MTSFITQQSAETIKNFFGTDLDKIEICDDVKLIWLDVDFIDFNTIKIISIAQKIGKFENENIDLCCSQTGEVLSSYDSICGDAYHLNLTI